MIYKVDTIDRLYIYIYIHISIYVLKRNPPVENAPVLFPGDFQRPKTPLLTAHPTFLTPFDATWRELSKFVEFFQFGSKLKELPKGPTISF